MNAATTQVVKDLLAQGKSREEIKAALLAKGVGADSVDDVLDIMMPAGTQPASLASPAPVPPQETNTTETPPTQPPDSLPPTPVAGPAPSVEAAPPSSATLISSPPPARRLMNAPPAASPTPIVAPKPSPPPATVPAAAPSQIMPRKKSKLKGVLLGLIIVTIGAGGGIYAYSRVQPTAYQNAVQKLGGNPPKAAQTLTSNPSTSPSSSNTAPGSGTDSASNAASSSDPTADGSDADTGPDSLDDGQPSSDSTDTDTSRTNQN